MTASPDELTHGRFRRSALLWAVLACTLLGIAMIGSWKLLNDSNRRNIESLTNQETQSTELLIRRDIAARLAAIDRLANRWTVAGRTPRAMWEADAIHYLADMPGFQSIEWVDTSQHIRWIVPKEGNEGRQDRDVSQTEPARTAFTASRENSEPRLSQPFEFVQGGLSILIYAPLTRDEQFDGLIVGVLRLGPWLNTMLSSSQSANYDTRVFLTDKLAYEHGYTEKSIDNTLTSHQEFEVQGLQWAIKVTPTKELLSTIRLQGSSLILISGLLLSILFGLLVYLSLNSRLRARELRAANRQHAALMINLQGMVYRTLDLEYPWPMVFVSEGCKTLCGHKQADMEQQRVLWGELIHPEDLEHVITVVRNAVKNDDAFDLEYRIHTKEETEKWVWERGRCVTNPDTNQRDLEGFVSDITERKLAELRLIQEQAYSKTIVDTAAEAVITFDTTGSINSFNLAAEKMFNYSRVEVLGENINTLIPPAYRDQYDGYRRRYIETGKGHIFDTPQNASALRKDGSIFPIQFSISEIEDQSKQMFVALIRDISLEKAAEAEAHQQREQLAHVDRLHLLGDMASGIAHEINQPLTSISLFSQAGKRFLDSGAFERLPDIFDKLSKHALRAGSIIEQMQLMTRQRESNKTLIDCNNLISEITQLAEAEAHIHDIEIEVSISTELPSVSVDTIQIQQVTLNLLRNGMEAMRSIECRNGNTIQLIARPREDGDVEIMVIDSGGGVPPEIAVKLFTPFSTTKDSGMGIGLSISRAIVTAHGGQLDFVNNESGGAVFSFNLPAAKQDEQNG